MSFSTGFVVVCGVSFLGASVFGVVCVFWLGLFSFGVSASLLTSLTTSLFTSLASGSVIVLSSITELSTLLFVSSWICAISCSGCFCTWFMITGVATTVDTTTVVVIAVAIVCALINNNIYFIIFNYLILFY